MCHHRIARAALCITLALCLCLPTGCQAQERGHTILLIVEREEGFYWSNLIEGACLAAQEADWTLTLSPYDEERGIDAMLEEAQQQGADYIALALNPAHLPANYAGAEKLILLGASLYTPSAAVYITDQQSTIGKRAGQLCAQRVGLQKNWLLLTNTGSFSYEDAWETALRGELGLQGSNVHVRIDCQDNVQIAYQRCHQVLSINPNIDGIICTGENATLGALRAVRTLGVSVPIIGAEFNDDIALGLRDGLVRATVVRSAYACGYIGVENAIRLDTGRTAESRKELDAVYVDVNNMYDHELLSFLYEIK